MASTVMSRPEEGRMHALATKAAQEEFPELQQWLESKETHVLVGVEYHDCDWANPLKAVKDHFYWIKAYGTHTVPIIKEKYRGYHGDSSLNVTFFHEGIVVDHAALSSLSEVHRDQLVILTTQTLYDLKGPFIQNFDQLRGPRIPTRPSSQQQGVARPGNNLLDLAPVAPDQSLFMDQHDNPAAGGHTTTHESFAMDIDSQPSEMEYVPRTVVNPFKASVPVEHTGPPPSTVMQQLLELSSPEKFEATVKRGVSLLAELEKPLLEISHDQDAQIWLEQIKENRAMAFKNRTVLGVVGNTGAGKSSVINALLDEERLVPTNCMRACTAVVTEISYNDSNKPAARYKAEIEFVHPDDWRRELKVLFDELFEESGNMSPDVCNPDTTAGVAFAKIRAVYPDFTKEMLKKSSADQLMNVASVKAVLGTKKRIQSSDCTSFYQRLQHYVDSRQNDQTDQFGKKNVKAKREAELWPLIKVVRIFTKANVLSTGAVLVDLPGIQDSNAARAAVADRYMKECTGLFVVAPINRAVDDKAARNLLGTTFKRQLKYDGSYSAVTFICSKTDEISKTEAVETLNFGSRLSDLSSERSSVIKDKEMVEYELQKVRAERDEDDPLEKIEAWNARISDLQDASRRVEARSMKRKHPSQTQFTDISDEQSLTAEQANTEIEKLKKLKASAIQDRQKMRTKIKEFEERLEQLKARKATLDDDEDSMCITGRNDWTRRHIRKDFADGIKELDQENAGQESDDFDPETDVRDYKEVSRSLPVFCVSSRAYQKLCGRLQKDGRVAGFTSTEQTEIPQLQAHCHKLTESGREAACRRFINSISRLLTSLSLWASDDGNDRKMTDEQRNTLKTFVTSNLHRLGTVLFQAASQTMDDAIACLNAQLYDKFALAGHAAAVQAVATATGWGKPREEGGLFWATYKATVRRYGVFQGSAGARNFNHELAEPLYKELASHWERAFHSRLPTVFHALPPVTNAILNDFHLVIEAKCKEQSLVVNRVARLKANIPVYESAFGDLSRTILKNINEAQREVNREFTPSVTAAMAPAYDHCTNESGRNSFTRMKNHMLEHVTDGQNSMFQGATDAVKADLNTLCDQVRKNMRSRVKYLYDSLSRDYMTIFGSGAGKDRILPTQAKNVRKKVEEIVAKGEAAFVEVVNCSSLAELSQDEDYEMGEGDGEEDEESDVEDANVPLALLAGEDAEGEDEEMKE